MKTLRSIWRILTLKCDESSKLLSSELDGDLALADRLALRGHLLACSSCRGFHKQMALLKKLAAALRDQVRLSPEARERLKDAIRRAS